VHQLQGKITVQWIQTRRAIILVVVVGGVGKPRLVSLFSHLMGWVYWFPYISSILSCTGSSSFITIQLSIHRYHCFRTYYSVTLTAIFGVGSKNSYPRPGFNFCKLLTVILKFYFMSFKTEPKILGKGWSAFVSWYDENSAGFSKVTRCCWRVGAPDVASLTTSADSH
jgi:hypothetical protein